MEDIPDAIDVKADNVLEKVENILKEASPNLSGNVLIGHIVSGAIRNVSKLIIPAAASLYVSTVSSIEHCSIGTGIN